MVKVHHYHHIASFLNMGITKLNTHAPVISWPTITRQIQDPIFMHIDHNFCMCSKYFSEN